MVNLNAINGPIDCRDVIVSDGSLYSFTASQNLAPALLMVFGLVALCAWLISDAAGGSTARTAFRVILMISALSIVAGALLLRG